jgi:pyrroloquinoline quinone biosynthesis protein B
LTGGDVDAIAGLLHLRERHRFTVYGPSRVLAILAANPIFDVLAPDCVRRVESPLDKRIELVAAPGPSGLAVTAFALPGKVPLYLETAGQNPEVSEEGDAVGLEIIETATQVNRFFHPRLRGDDRAAPSPTCGSALVFSTGPYGATTR